jgi:sugar fermentation stimulation protein A
MSFMNSGVYLAIFRLPRTQVIAIGRLGSFTLRRGFYLYVGSAQRNLEARLARHSRRRKPLRWQIDYLSTRAPLVDALVLRRPKRWECRLAALLAKHYPRPIAQFGASDVRRFGLSMWRTLVLLLPGMSGATSCRECHQG